MRKYVNGVGNALNRKSGDMVPLSFHRGPEEEDEEGPSLWHPLPYAKEGSMNRKKGTNHTG